PHLAVGRATHVTFGADQDHHAVGAGDAAQLLTAQVRAVARGLPRFAVRAEGDGAIGSGFAAHHEQAARRRYELDAAVIEVEAELAAFFPSLPVVRDARRVAAGHESAVAV